MWPGYTLWTGLTPYDVSAIQSLYGVRSADPFESSTGNETTESAFALTQNGNLTAFSADITKIDDVDVYRFTTPSSSSITGLTINLQAQGISLLTSRVTVLDAQGNVVASAVTTDPLGNNLSIDVADYQPSTTYFVKVEGAGSNVFSVGAYVLRLSYTGETYGNSFAFGSSYVNTESGSNDTSDSAATLGFTSDAHTAMFAAVGQIDNSADVDWYRVTPTDVTNNSGTLTVGVVPIDANGLRPTVAVFEIDHDRVELLLVGLVVVERPREALEGRAGHEIPVTGIGRRLHERLEIQDEPLLLRLGVDCRGVRADILHVRIEHPGIGTIGRAFPHGALGPVLLRNGGGRRERQHRGREADSLHLHGLSLFCCSPPSGGA
jgi:hypothetical protein